MNLKKQISASKLPLVVVVGETASGKSDLGMKIAKEFKGEIIAADSRTVYKGMDIGTAKPTPQDQKQIPHHLLDVVEPSQQFTAADFKKLANQAIKDIRFRGKLPVMVGGTGLYVDSVIFDFNFAPKANQKIRSHLEKLGKEELRNKILEKGGVEVDLNNRRHMIRYLETGGTPKNNTKLIPNILLIGLRLPRQELRERINSRVERMFRAGLRKEIDDLVKKYGWDAPGMEGIIYKLFRQYKDKKISMGEVKRQFAQKDYLLAKRQRTWFKRNPNIKWFDNPNDALNYAREKLRCAKDGA